MPDPKLLTLFQKNACSRLIGAELETVEMI